MAKHDLKITAVSLRKLGLSYSQIQQQVSVSQSTLSLWLHSVDLSDEQKRTISERQRKASSRTRRRNRRLRQQSIYSSERRRINSLTPRELWLMGTVLYWAEGSKEKEYSPGSGVEFTNSDPTLVGLFIDWIRNACGVDEDRLVFAIYIHESHSESMERIRDYWVREAAIPRDRLDKFYFKNHRPTNRRNTGRAYHGVLRVRVKASRMSFEKSPDGCSASGNAVGMPIPAPSDSRNHRPTSVT